MNIKIHIPIIGRATPAGRKPFLRMTHPETGTVYDLNKPAAQAFLAELEKAGDDLGKGMLALRADLRRVFPEFHTSVADAEADGWQRCYVGNHGRVYGFKPGNHRFHRCTKSTAQKL